MQYGTIRSLAVGERWIKSVFNTGLYEPEANEQNVWFKMNCKGVGTGGREFKF